MKSTSGLFTFKTIQPKMKARALKTFKAIQNKFEISIFEDFEFWIYLAHPNPKHSVPWI
jgi:hypothetical protein